VGRARIEDHRLEIEDGHTIGYATWGVPGGTPVLICHGTPGSRRDRYPLLEDEGWLQRRGVRFVGVDRPGYGDSDPRSDAGLAECAGLYLRVADTLGIEDFSVFGVSGGGPHAIALGALAPARVGRVAVVAGLGTLDRPDALEGMGEANVEEFGMAKESPDELQTALEEEARALRDDPEAAIDALFSAFSEVERRALEDPELRRILQETAEVATRQGAAGWVEDDLRFVRPWPFTLEEVAVEVFLYHGEEDVLVPAQHARALAEKLPEGRLRSYPGEGHFSMKDHMEEVFDDLLGP
jgi:pimeloyl-ACP methyl ester carboxylesterase